MITLIGREPELGIKMQKLGATVGVFALLALIVGAHRGDPETLLLTAAALICAYTTWRSDRISSFMKIFVGTFSTEVVVFGLIHLFEMEEFWPAALKDYTLPESMPLTVAVFSILVFALSHVPVVGRATRIADLFFNSSHETESTIWGVRIWRGRERALAVAMIVLLVLINQGQVGINVRLSFFNRDFFNAIQEKNQPEFWRQLLMVFTPWAFIYVTSAVVEFVMQSLVLLRWRRWLTQYYVSHWLSRQSHYRMTLEGGETDNPDQRISEDIRSFIEGDATGNGIYSYSITLISTLSSLVSFSIVLWDLSGNYPLPGTDIHLPGFLFWVALVYATIGTLITFVIGRSLNVLYFERQRREADFRFSLARLREYSEQIALLSGEPAEQASLTRRFSAIVTNFLALVKKRKQLLAFTASYGQISPIIPYILTAPFYFAGKIQLGVMSQTSRAFSNVEEALNFFVTYYTSLASFRAVLDRLSSFDEAIDLADSRRADAAVAQGPSGAPISLKEVVLALPDGRKIVEAKALDFARGESVLLSGPSGSGKSTLFRAIAGIWPYRHGSIALPAGDSVMLLPQRPYIPIGSLRAAVAYPREEHAYSDREIQSALETAQLTAFVSRLDEENGWGQRLSGGEQQRVAIARALLQKPDWLFLDEATSALDEALEARLYKLLRERLPHTTVISIGHRGTLAAFHQRHLVMEAGEDGLFAPREKVLA
jgi:vitamin B12/bleomycin/antimicrobial peptide transport system ATP-binding/permease protein